MEMQIQQCREVTHGSWAYRFFNHNLGCLWDELEEFWQTCTRFSHAHSILSDVIIFHSKENLALFCLWVIANISKVLPNDDDAPPGCVDDMTTKLFYLHEPGVLQNLHTVKIY